MACITAVLATTRSTIEALSSLALLQHLTTTIWINQFIFIFIAAAFFRHVSTAFDMAVHVAMTHNKVADLARRGMGAALRGMGWAVQHVAQVFAGFLLFGGENLAAVLEAADGQLLVPTDAG